MKYLLFVLSLSLVFAGCSGDWVDYSLIDMTGAPIAYNDADAPLHLNVAAAAIQPDKTDKSVAMNKMKSMIAKIKSEHDDIQVIVFGEMILGWYEDPAQGAAYIAGLAETVPGPATDSMAIFAAAHNVTVVFGLAEHDIANNKYYNTQVLIRPNGELVRYRKRNLNLTDVANGITPGTELVTTDVYGVKAAMFICSDMQSESLAEEIAAAKPGVILHSLTSTSYFNDRMSYLAGQFNSWIVFANRAGTEGDLPYNGFIHIINPAGTFAENATGTDHYVYRRIGIFPN